jgi:hypothetical protein
VKLLDLPRNETRHAELHLSLACLMIGLGGLLLGLQVDGNGDLVGTGYTALGVGGLVALAASLVQASVGGRLPTDWVAGFSAACGFLGMSFCVAGVLAPGGSWMFFEVLLLFWLLARRRSRSQPGGPEITGGTLVAMGLMLIFRLWITWQGSEHRWAVMSIELPIVSWLDAPWLEAVRTVNLGSFTPQELGFPQTGIDFPISMTLWSAGFALAATGLWMRNRAARDHQDDRIHALIHTLPPGPAALVERLVPEEEWETLGLHGLPIRRIAKRLESLVAERMQRYQEVRSSILRSPLAELAAGEDFAGAVSRALSRGLPEDTERQIER